MFVTPDMEDDSRKAIQIPVVPGDGADASLRSDEQLLVFQYRGKFHAINNVRLRGQFDQQKR